MFSFIRPDVILAFRPIREQIGTGIDKIAVCGHDRRQIACQSRGTPGLLDRDAAEILAKSAFNFHFPSKSGTEPDGGGPNRSVNRHGPPELGSP